MREVVLNTVNISGNIATRFFLKKARRAFEASGFESMAAIWYIQDFAILIVSFLRRLLPRIVRKMASSAGIQGGLCIICTGAGIQLGQQQNYICFIIMVLQESNQTLRP